VWQATSRSIHIHSGLTRELPLATILEGKLPGQQVKTIWARFSFIGTTSGPSRAERRLHICYRRSVEHESLDVSQGTPAQGAALVVCAVRDSTTSSQLPTPADLRGRKTIR